jgi:O-antigen ligase
LSLRLFSSALLVAVMWGALAFAAVYPWAYLPLAAWSAVLGVWGFLATRGRSPWTIDPLAIALAAAAIGIALQTVPLPYDLFTRISPAGDRYLRAQFVQFAVNPPPVHPLSLSPQNTWLAFWLFSGLTLGYFGIVRAFGWLQLESLVVRILIFGVALAVLAVVQSATLDPNDPLVYGFWRPRQPTRPFGPFINRNNFAGWMTMAVPLAMGYSFAVFQTSSRPRSTGFGQWLLWLSRPEGSRFALVVFSVLAMATAVALSTSRSGMASVAIAVAVMSTIAMTRPGGQIRWLAGFYVVGLIAGAVAWAGVGATIDRFSLSAADMPGRLLAWQDTLRIIEDFPWTGVGIGAFGPAMLQYQSFGRRSIYYQAHNDYLEVFAEGGLLIAVPIVLAALVFLARVWHRFREPEHDPMRFWVRTGAVGSLAGIAAQSTVEFSLQMPGNAMLFVVIAAIATRKAARSQSGVTSSSGRRSVNRGRDSDRPHGESELGVDEAEPLAGNRPRV